MARPWRGRVNLDPLGSFRLALGVVGIIQDRWVKSGAPLASASYFGFI